MAIPSKQVGGTYLPAGETHMAEWMERQQQWRGGRLCYQLTKYEMALRHVRERRVAVDAGAHVGTWAMHMVEDFERVIAFEPSRRADIFPLNVRGDNWTLHRVALSDHRGRVAMEEESPQSSGGHHIVPGIGRTLCMTLDSYALEAVDFIKIDVEGHELPLVRGAAGTIQRCRPVVLVEQKGWNHAHERDGNRDAVRFLETLGMTAAEEQSGDVVMVWR